MTDDASKPRGRAKGSSELTGAAPRAGAGGPATRRRPGAWRWAALAATVVLLAAWPVSIFTTLGWTDYSSGGRLRCAVLTRGCLDLVWGGVFKGGQPEWVAIAASPDETTVWWPRYERPGLAFPYSTLLIPLWIPLVLVAAPAAWSWWRFLHPPKSPTACRGCGYELAGLAAAAPCPECGRSRPGRVSVG